MIALKENSIAPGKFNRRAPKRERHGKGRNLKMAGERRRDYF
jgi:hypothetical protein